MSAAHAEPAPTPSVRGLGVLRRLGWGVIDQGVSSLSNFAMGVLVARALGPDRFGAFTLAYVTYGVVLNASRGLATDPLLVRHSGSRTPRWRRACAEATATGVLVGLVTGVACIAVGVALPGNVGPGFVALGVVLPGLLLQDAWRFVFFSSGNAEQAVVNDAIWAVLQLAAIGALFVTDTASVWLCVLAFGGTALLAGLVGLVQTRILPRLDGVRTWLRTNIDLGGRYVIENVSISGARQMRFVVLGGLIGLAAVGQVRAAEMLMGPFLVILMGMSQVAVPEASQVLRRAPEKLGWFCFGFGIAQASACAAWGVLMLVVLPHGLGEALLGSLWHPAAALLPLVTIGICGAGFEAGAAAGVRALGAAPRSLRAQLINSAVYLTGGIIGAVVDGARGTCVGVAVATMVGATVWWTQLQRARAEHVPVERDDEEVADA